MPSMSTVVLARKYRPKRFAQMVGQEHVVQALTNALQSQRLHHAYLFTGTRGIGKTTVSRILAKSLNCTGPDGSGGITAEPCGVCQACTEIDADRYLDYTEMDAASNRGIDDIRDTIERAAYKPGLGRFKVFMIDEVHMLTKEAFNALLKTLEEPPEYLKFVLATTDPDKVLPTVLSRCLQFNLRPMAPATVREHLAQVLQAEGVASDDGGLRLLAQAARGSMRDALSLTDQAIAYGAGRVDEAVVRAMLGSVDHAHASTLVRALARRDGAAVLETVGTLRSQGLSAAATLDALAQLLQQMAVEQAVPGALDADDPLAADARTLAPLLTPEETQLLYSMALHGRPELALMSDEHAALTMVLLRFLAFPQAGSALAPREPRSAPLRAPAPPAISVPRVAVAPAAKAAVAPQVPVAPPASAPAPAPAPAPMVQAPADAALGDRWEQLVKALAEQGSIAALVRELAQQAGLRAIEGNRWHLVVASEPLRNATLADKLAAAISTRLGGEPVVLELEAGTPGDSPAQRDAAERARRQAAAEATIRQDPVVLDLMQQFKSARLVPGSIKPA
jgi:DNA polymerase III subunit gamma/tau